MPSSGWPTRWGHSESVFDYERPRFAKHCSLLQSGPPNRSEGRFAMPAVLCPASASVPRSAAAKAFKLQGASRKSRHIKQNYYLGGACGGLRRFRQRMTCRDLAGQARFSRFDPIRLRLEHDRKDFIGAIGARNALRAPCGDERKTMDVSEDGIRGLRRFGRSSRSLSDLVDAEEVSRHLGITPRRVLSMARKGSIPCVRLSAKTIRFDIEAVDRALGRR